MERNAAEHQCQPRGRRIGQALTVSLYAANRSITRVVDIPQWVPTPANRRLRHALTTLDSIVYQIIAARRRGGEAPGDLLSMLMAARDEETGEGMTTFLAGHETTAIALGWTWYLLSRHPTAAQQLRDELAEVLAGGCPGSTTCAARLHRSGDQGIDASVSACVDHLAVRDRNRSHRGYDIPAGQSSSRARLRDAPTDPIMGQPVGLQPGAVRLNAGQGAAAVRLLPLRRRTASVHRATRSR